MLLLVDNYDSFVHNLARYLRRLGADVKLLRNDSPLLIDTARESSAIVISPGPCGPEQAGDCISLVQQLTGKVPILGVCLGHQVVCHAFGGRVIRAQRPIHGMALPIELFACPLFEGLPRIAPFARYHSLIAEKESLPECLNITAVSCSMQDSDLSEQSEAPSRSSIQSCLDSAGNFSEIMAVEHRSHPTYGVQFHPESILSECGYKLLSNFLRLSGIAQSNCLPESDLC